MYKGISNDPERRVKEHNVGKNKSTKSKKPWKLVYIEKCLNRSEAREREKYFKSGSGREKLKKLIFPDSSMVERPPVKR